MKLKRTIYSLCLGIGFSLILLASAFLIKDFRVYPLTLSDVDFMMSTKNVASHANVQGSRIYIIADENGFVYHTFETSSPLTNRFRHLHQAEFDGESPLYGVLLGRWSNFQITVTGTHIEYNLHRGQPSPRHRRMQTGQTVSFVSGVVIFTFSAHGILSAKSKKGDEVR